MDSTAFTLTPDQEKIKDAARQFGENWAPYATEIDRNDNAPTAAMVQDTVDLELAGLTIPQEFGGRGFSAIEFALAVEQACRSMKSWMAGDILFATTCTGPSVIMMSDNTVAQQRYLPRIASGECTAAIALSEPKYGSAVTDIETAATARGDSLYLNGSKRFITGAPDYDVYVTFVRLNGTAGMRGVGAVVVEKGTPGFTLGVGPEYMGSRGSPHGELYFEDCQVPQENLLMGEGSFPLLMQAFNMERLYISALCLGLAQGAFDEAVAYSNDREQFGQPINEFQAVYHLIAEMWTQIESVRYLTYKAALTAERGKFPLPPDVSTSKLHAADMGRDVCWKAMQILGGNGLVTGFPPGTVLPRRDRVVDCRRDGTGPQEHDRCRAPG